MSNETCVECTALRRALEKEVEARASERAGRIRAERELRSLRNQMNALEHVGVSGPVPSTGEVYPLVVLGTFRSCFNRRNGTPRQPHLVPLARGSVILRPHIPNVALEGLHEFSHVWLLFVFHENTDDRKGNTRTPRAKIRVPRLNGERRGVLATRSPHRPSPIGLSLAVVRSVDLQNGLLEVGGADLVDGTPILDIKPFLPFCDTPPLEGPEVFAPDWVAAESSAAAGEPLKLSAVKWAPDARQRLQDIWTARGGARRSLYHSAEELMMFVEQALSRDIRSAHQRLQGATSDSVGKFEVILDGVSMRYDLRSGDTGGPCWVVITSNINLHA